MSPRQGSSPQVVRGETRSVGSEEKGATLRNLPGLSTLVARDPMTWSASDPDNAIKPNDHLHELKPDDIAEVEGALQNFKKLDLNGDEVTCENFSLPGLKELLERAAINIHRGCGFSIIRGLNPSRYSAEDNLIIFLGLANYIGDIRGLQGSKGEMLYHITDAKHWKTPHSQRHGIHTNANMPFHNDMGADIVALNVRQCAKDGGHTYIASAGQVFCDLVANHPAVIKTLSESNWPMQVSGRSNRFIFAPLLQWHGARIMVSLDQGRLGVHPTAAATVRTSGSHVPSLIPAQHQALSALYTAATKHRLRLDTEPGDIVFLNNWGLLHARDSYIDSNSNDGPRRHLVRLWLRNSRLAWDVPPGMKYPWVSAYGSDGMGDKSNESNRTPWRGSRTMQRSYPVVPPAEYVVAKYTAASAGFMVVDSESEDEE